jgi:hypothetical protein
VGRIHRLRAKPTLKRGIQVAALKNSTNDRVTDVNEAAYLKNDMTDTRILFTGFRDKQKAREEAKQMADYHEHKMPHKNLFKTVREMSEDSKPVDRKSR